jgi:hypothetical protein
MSLTRVTDLKQMKRDPKSSLRERLEAEATRLTEKARLLPAGKQRSILLRKARELEMAASVTEWIESPGLQPPR